MTVWINISFESEPVNLKRPEPATIPQSKFLLLHAGWTVAVSTAWTVAVSNSRAEHFLQARSKASDHIARSTQGAGPLCSRRSIRICSHLPHAAEPALFCLHHLLEHKELDYLTSVLMQGRRKDFSILFHCCAGPMTSSPRGASLASLTPE